MAASWRRYEKNGELVLLLHGAWCEDMLPELKKSDYDYIQFHQIYDWESFFPVIKDYALSVKIVDTDYSFHLRNLKDFTELEGLYMCIDGTQEKPPDLSIFRKLKSAAFYWHKKYASAIATLPQLSHLHIFGYGESDFVTLGKVRNLTHITLTRGKLTSLDGIQELALEDVELNYLRNLTDIGALATQHGLKKFSIMNVAKIADLSPINQLHELEYLYLFNCGTLPNFDWVKDLNNIAKFWVPIPCESLDWHALLSRPKLELMGVSPPKEAFRSEDDLRAIAASYGKTITKFLILGTKKSPLYSFEFSETEYRKKHDPYFNVDFTKLD